MASVPLDKPLEQWSMSEVKRLLVSHGVDYSGCLEKVILLNLFINNKRLLGTA